MQFRASIFTSFGLRQYRSYTVQSLRKKLSMNAERRSIVVTGKMMVTDFMTVTLTRAVAVVITAMASIEDSFVKPEAETIPLSERYSDQGLMFKSAQQAVACAPNFLAEGSVVAEKGYSWRQVCRG